jgi:hypothetical protein
VSTGGAFEKPVPLICLLECLVNPIVGDGGVRELQAFFKFAVPHALLRHVHGLLGGLVQFIVNDKVNRDRLQTHPGDHAPEIKKGIPDPLDAGGIGICDPPPNSLRVVVNQGRNTALGEVQHIGFRGKKIEDATVRAIPGPVHRPEHGFGGQAQLGSLHFHLVGVAVFIRGSEVFMVLKSEGPTVQEYRRRFGTLPHGPISLPVAGIKLKLNGSQDLSE